MAHSNALSTLFTLSSAKHSRYGFFMKFLMILLLSFTLAACGAHPDAGGRLTPFPAKNDLPDEKLTEAVTAFLAIREAPANSTYDFARVDLNNDGLRDGIVLFKTPHTYWCGWDGCGMAVFKSGKKKFTPFSTISGVHGPVYVATTSHKGWRDIIIRISGANMPDKNVLIAFDGTRYPHSPLLAPNYNGKLSASNLEKYLQ